MDRTVVSLAACATIVLIVMFASIGYVRVQNQHALVDMVAKGANPIAAHCALDGINTRNQGVCQAVATQPLSKSLEK
jgi:hypothetical protein